MTKIINLNQYKKQKEKNGKRADLALEIASTIYDLDPIVDIDVIADDICESSIPNGGLSDLHKYLCRLIDSYQIASLERHLSESKHMVFSHFANEFNERDRLHANKEKKPPIVRTPFDP